MSFESVYDISGSLKNLYGSRIGEDDSSVGSRESSWSTLSLSRRGSFTNMKKKLRASFRLKPKSLIDKGGEATAADFEKISDLWIKSCTVKGCSLTNIKKITKEFDKRIRAVEVKSKLCLANCDLVDDQILCLCQTLAKYPVIITLDLTGNNLMTQKSVSHLQDLVDSELMCATTMAGEEYLYCAGFLSKLLLPEHLGPQEHLLKVCGELDLINLRLAIGREYRKINSPDPLTDDVLLQIWSQISEAPAKNLKAAIQDGIADQSISVPNNYSFHQAEIILVRGLGKAKQVTRENVDFVRTSSFYKEPMLPPNDPSPAVTPKPLAADLSTLSEQPTEEEQLQPLSDTVDDYIDTNNHVKNENIDPVEEFLSSPSVDLYSPDPLQNKVISMDLIGSPVSSLGHSMAASYFDQPLQSSQKPGLGFEGHPSPVSRQPTLKTQQTAATYLTLEQAIPADINDHHVHAYSKEPIVVDTSRVAFDGSLEIEEDDVDEATDEKELIEDKISKQHQATEKSTKFTDTSMTAMDGSRAYLDDDDEEDDATEDPKGFLPTNMADDSHLHTIVEENEEEHEEVDVSDVTDKRSDISSIQQQERHHYMESSSVSETLEDNSGHGSQEQPEANPFSSPNQAETAGYDQNYWQQHGYYYYGGDGQQYYQEGIAAANADVANTAEVDAAYAYPPDQYYGYETTAPAEHNDPNVNYHQDEEYPTYTADAYTDAAAADQQYYDANNAYNYENQYAAAEYTANDYNENAYYQQNQGEYATAADEKPPTYDGYDQQGYYYGTDYQYPTAEHNQEYYDYYYQQPASTTDGANALETSKLDENDRETNVNQDANDDHADVGSDLSSDVDEEEEVEVIDDAEKLTGVDRPSPKPRPGFNKDVSVRLEYVYGHEKNDEGKDENQFFYNTQPNQEILRRSSSSFLAQQNQSHQNHGLKKIFESVGSGLSAESFDVYDGKPDDPVASETKEEVQPQENPLRRYSSADLRCLSWTTGSRRESFRSVSHLIGDTNKPDSNSLPETTGKVYSMGDINAAVDNKHHPLGEALTKDLTYYKDLLDKVQASKLRSDELIKDAEEEEKLKSIVKKENIEIQEGNCSQNEQKSENIGKSCPDQEQSNVLKTANPSLSTSAMNTSAIDVKRRQFHSALADQTRPKRVAFGTELTEKSPDKLSVDTSPMMELDTTMVSKKPPLPKKPSTVIISKIVKDKKLTPLEVSSSQSIPRQVTDLSPMEIASIRQLDLSNSNIHDLGAIFFSPPTPNNKNVHAPVLIPWQNLIVLNLAENHIKSLDVPLPPSLKYLDLSRNLIGNPQAIRILSLNQQLQYLDLSDNYRMLQKQNAVLVGTSIRSWFPKLAVHQMKLLSSISTTESAPIANSVDAAPHSPTDNNEKTTANQQIVETYEENHILHFFSDAFVRHIRHWKSILKPFTVQSPTHHALQLTKSKNDAFSSSTSPPKNASSGSVTSTVDTTGSLLPLSPNSAASAPSLQPEIPSQGKVKNEPITGKLPVVLSGKGDKTDYLSIKTRIIEELLAIKPAAPTSSTGSSALSTAATTTAAKQQKKKKSKENKPTAKSTNIASSNNAPAVSIDVQREKDEQRFKYYQKQKENLEKSIVQQEKSMLSQLKQQSVHKKRLQNTDVKDLVSRLHDTQVSELKRKDEQRKKKEEDELAEKRNALKNVKKMTQKYYDRLTNVSRLSSQEMRSQLELYEQSLLDLEDDLTGFASGSESDTHSLSSRSSRSSHGSHASSLSSSSANSQRRGNKSNNKSSSHSNLLAAENDKTVMNKIKSKRLISVQSSPKVLRRKKSRVKDDGVFGMFTRSSHTLTSQQTNEKNGHDGSDDEDDEEVILVDDLDVDVLVEDDLHDDLHSLGSSGRSRSGSFASTVSSISRSSSIGHPHHHNHHHHHQQDTSKVSSQQPSVHNRGRNKKNLTISVDSSMSSSMLSQGKTGIVKADKAALLSKTGKGNPLLASHSFYVAPSLPGHALPPPPVPLSPTMQSLLPRRNLNSDFDIVNALIHSPSSHMAMRSPKHNGSNNLPSSVVHGGNFSPRASHSHLPSQRSLLLNSPGASSVASSTSLISHVSSVSAHSHASQLSASFRLQLPESFTHTTNNNTASSTTSKSTALSKEQRKNLHRIAKVAAAGKAVATEATGGLDIPEVNAWARHSRDALGRCAILLHLLIDLATSTAASSSGAMSTATPLWLNPTYHSICEEWQELGFIFYDTDTTSLPIDTTTVSHPRTTQKTHSGKIKPFPGLDKTQNNFDTLGGDTPENKEMQIMKRASSFHFTASVPRPDFLTTMRSGFQNKKKEEDESDGEEEEEEEEEDPWPKTSIAARALGLDVTKADCEDLWMQLSEYHKLFVQLKSVLDLAVQQQKEEYDASLSDTDKAKNQTSSLNIAAMVKRVLQTPLGQRVNARSGNVF